MKKLTRESKMRQIEWWLMAVCGVLLSSVCNAALIEADLFNSGDRLVTRDQETGLEWLDLTPTDGLTRAEALAAWAPRGFRLATIQEVESLSGHFRRDFPGPGDYRPASTFIEYLGVTSTYLPGYQYSFGYVQPYSGSSIGTDAFRVVATPYGVGAFDPITLIAGPPHPDYATFLVRNFACSGFADVEWTDTFCQNVEWLRNRSITLGCSSAYMYCPGESVSRLSMGAFINRVGSVVLPSFDLVQTSAALDTNSLPRLVVCRTSDLAVAGYPRQAALSAQFSARTAAAVGLISIQLMASRDNGYNWSAVSEPMMRSVSSEFRTVSALGGLDIGIREGIRFGLRLDWLEGESFLPESTCTLSYALHNRNATTAPY